MATFIGDGGNNSLIGNVGNDSLSGLSGQDTLDGGTGNDTVDAGTEDDLITSSAGIDSVDGGSGVDTLAFSYGVVSPPPNRATTLTNYNAVSGSGSISDGVNQVTFTGIEKFIINAGNGSSNINLSATIADISVTSNNGNDTILGGAGNDTINAGGGIDRLTGGAGHDHFREDVGYINAPSIGPDTITDFQTGPNGDVLDMDNYFLSNLQLHGNENPFVTGHLMLVQSGLDTLLKVGGTTAVVLQNTTATAFTKDNFSYQYDPNGIGVVLNGDQGNNSLVGSFDNDTISGNGGQDSLSGGSGNDSLSGGSLSDHILGGFGDDTIVGGDGYDGLYGEDGDDSIVDTDGAFLIGDTGNDTLVGGTASYLDGGLGNDLLIDDGTSTAHFDEAVSGSTVIANLTAGTASGGWVGNDTLIGVENLQGSASNDTFIGDAAANSLLGNDGADSLSGVGGADFLQGGLGDDTVDGGSGNDTLDDFGGNDLAIYSGSRWDYAISWDGTSFTIRDRRALSPDGTDHVTGVENFQFADRTMDAETLKDHTPPQVTSTFPADESTVPYDTIGPTVIHFSEPITHGIGQIEVDGFGPSLIDQSDFTISGDTLTIDTGFAAGQSYTVTLPIGVIQDAAGNAFDGGSFSYSVENLPSYGLGTTAIQVILGTNIIANDVPLDMAAWDPAQLADGTVTFGSATQVNILGATDGLTYELFGDFFWFDGPSYGDLAADDLSSIAVFDNGSGAHHLLYLISNLQGLLPNEDALHGLDPDVVANNGLGFWLDEWSGNSIAGSSASDNLFGREGNDSLDGLNGNDTLTGSEGNDIIAGGAGADLLTGGIGVDTFQVSKISDLVAGDEITDLEPGDVIDLSAIAGLSFIGSAAFSGIPGQLNYLWNGGQTILQIDSNGDRIADAFLNLDGGQFVLGETSAGSEKLHIVGGVPSPSLVEVSSAPTYGAPNPTFELQFDQNMQIGSGIIEIHNGSDGSLVGTLQLDSRSLGNGRSVFINANSVSGLHDSIPYYIVFAPGALRSQSGLDFAGISDPSTLTFSGGDTGPPKFLGSSPSVNATNVPVDSDIVLTFSEPVKSGSGTIFLKDLTSNQTDLLSTDDSSQVTYSGNQVIIDPASDLEPSHRYELSVSPGGIRDFTGNAFTDSVYDFFDTPDLVPPALLVSSLSNGAFGVNPFLSGFTFSFDKAVTAGSGFIEIRKTADGSLVSKIDIADPTESHFQLGGGYVDIRFPPTLDFGTTYSVTIDPGAIENLSGVPFAGLSSPMTFTTATLDQFGPVPIAFSPANHDTGSNPSANIVLTFSRDVIPATGDIIIHRASDQSVAARIAITDSSQVKFDGNIVTINPVSNLDKYTAYNIEMPFGLVYDHAGNAYLGTASTTDYSFTTAASPPFYLPDSNGLGPSLKVGGADVIAGQFGAWAPIAAEKTSNGYEIAWKNGNADTYTLWAADANGNYTGNLIGNVPGSDATLQSAETLFQQDLNGDGTVGLPTFTPIETHGATTLATADNRFYLQDSVGNGPVLSSNGANVLAGQFGVWTPIGAEKTSSGYEIAWKSGSADLYTLWATDANGNYTGNLIGNVSGSDATLQSAETLFHQDLNGDGTVGTAIQGNGQSGPVTIPIETHGATTLGTAGNQFYLQDSTGAGPALSVNGANVVAGQFGVWTPIAAEKTGSGYEIAWKSGSADLYTLWATDANGKYTGNLIGNVTGADPTLQSAEALFHQDLNGDGTVGIAIQSGQSGPFTTPIETHGVTTLGTAGNQFYLQDSTGAGPILSVNGTNVLAGQFGAWTPIAAEKTSSGYEIAWKSDSADLYTLWATDANGNYTGNLIGNVSGSDTTLQSAESLFQQDLNGDGTLGTAIQSNGQPGPITTPIETHGVTTLGTAGNHFYLQDSTGNGPVLSLNGADVVTGQFGAWAPIGAEKTSTGYEIAWKNGSADLYTLWATDAHGNYSGNLIGNVSGAEAALQSAETLFQQDLNQDGHFGLL